MTICILASLFETEDALICNYMLLTDYPRGWVYLKPARKYYRAVFELMDWNKADTRCREFGTSSRLVDINDAAENLAIKEFIASFHGTNCTLLFRWLDTIWLYRTNVTVAYIDFAQLFETALHKKNFSSGYLSCSI